MLRLRRTVRLVINPVEGDGEGVNGHGGKPAMRGFGRYYEFDAVCRGAPDPQTGYLINIKDVDLAVRRQVAPIIDAACRERPECEPATVMPEVFRSLAAALPIELESVTLRLTPTYGVTMSKRDQTTVILRQQFDLAAAHRLHVPALSDEENRQIFGRCNNPAGHGHNYRIEPAVAASVDSPFSLADLERITDETLIEWLDHKHLNEDIPEFASESGANPSVENIARLCHARLAPAIEAAGASLRSVTVWETDRTSCTFPDVPE